MATTEGTLPEGSIPLQNLNSYTEPIGVTVSGPDDSDPTTTSPAQALSARSSSLSYLFTFKECIGQIIKWIRQNFGLTEYSAIATVLLAIILIRPTLEAARDGHRAEEIAKWTSEKDYIEYCENHPLITGTCDRARKMTLAAPPGFNNESPDGGPGIWKRALETTARILNRENYYNSKNGGSARGGPSVAYQRAVQALIWVKGGIWAAQAFYNRPGPALRESSVRERRTNPIPNWYRWGWIVIKDWLFPLLDMFLMILAPFTYAPSSPATGSASK
ncbi:hypothetical protein QBC43DRAFT_311319 [Cladorrhinum sp. PSN259]|nr:hypothetical protein QBC43DRAFT_311319 [Cladorrhinum sp. PSN259]